MKWSEKQLLIMSVAEKLFAEKGYDGTSVREIAESAQINVAMVSYYFGSKEKLFFHLIQLKSDESYRSLVKVIRNSKLTPWQKMEYVIDSYTDKTIGNRHYHAIANLQIPITQRETISDLLISLKKRKFKLIEQILEEGRSQGVFREVDTGLTVMTIIGTLSQAQLSKPFYCTLLNIPAEDEERYYHDIKPLLKSHLKQMLKNHLVIYK